MKQILILGAGRSSCFLIDYLMDQGLTGNYRVQVADLSETLAAERIHNHPNGTAKALNTENKEARQSMIAEADLVISMLPAHMHPLAAADCLALGKHFFTASYVSSFMQEIAAEVEKKGLLFMNEAGLDPGLDHMSAMQVIHHLQSEGADIESFESYCGGLVAPESNDNPWGYKFSWNPRNVILAGQGTARYLEDGIMRFKPYHRLFAEAVQIEIPGAGKFDAYPNRDSVGYRETYGLQNIKTMIRGTLRAENFCKAWNLFVALGLTDDSFRINCSEMSYADVLNSFLPGKGALRERLFAFAGKDQTEAAEMVWWTGIGDELHIGLESASPAAILEKLLTEKWKLQNHDKDMIVMQHIFRYQLNGKKHLLTSSLINKGIDTHYTAMARTVGLPLAMLTDSFMKGEITGSGVQIPIQPQIYHPILKKLASAGIRFDEHVTLLS
jgi:saccharopine dehydrogenase (NADP+, L-glutamate forming)